MKSIVALVLLSASCGPAFSREGIITNVVSGRDSRFEFLSDDAYTLEPLTMAYTVETGSVSAHAELGYLAFEGTIQATDDLTPSGTSWVGEQLYFADLVRIHVPGREGQTGTVRLVYKVEGTIDLAGPGLNASAGYVLANGVENSQHLVYYRQYADGSSTGENTLNTVREHVATITFGEEFNITFTLDSLDARIQQDTVDDNGNSASLSIRVIVDGITGVTDSNDIPISDYEVVSRSGKDYSARKLWAAGPDLAANEAADGDVEKAPVNSRVPEWSYGYRSSVQGSSLSPFQEIEHGNDIGAPDVDGWNPGPTLLVNTADTNRSVDLSGTLSRDVLPGQILMLPTSSDFAVVRWTAPEDGTYSVAARWIDADASGGDGAAAHVVVNGVEIFGRTTDFAQGVPTANVGLAWPDGGGAEMPPKAFHLTAGDTIDFLVGSRGDAMADLTAFNSLVRRLTDLEITAPSSVEEGEPAVISIQGSPGSNLRGAALRIDGEVFATDLEAPFEFTLTDLTQGDHHLQAEAADGEGVLCSSEERVLRVDEPVGFTPFAQKKSGENGFGAAALAGSTYDCIASGLWSQADIWVRRSDGGNGIPGPDDVAVVPRSVQMTLDSDVSVAKLFCEGIVAGDGESRVLTVTDHFGIYGFLRDLEVTIPVEGLLTNVRGAAFLENAKVSCAGRMVLSQSLFGTESEISSTGSATLQAPPANGGPVVIAVNNVILDGTYSLGRGTGVLTESMVAAGAGNLLAILGPGLVGPDGASLVGPDGASLIGADGATLIGSDGASLIGPDGATLIGADGATLVGPDGASLIGPDGASLSKVNMAYLQAAAGFAGFAAPTTKVSGTIKVSSPLLAPGPPGLHFTGGTLKGTGNLLGAVTNSGANITPDGGGLNQAGRIRVVGSFVQGPEAGLVFRIGGTGLNPPQFDQFWITGNAILGGNLDISLLDGFNPLPGDSFAPLQFASSSGSFASVFSPLPFAYGPSGMTFTSPGAPTPRRLPLLQVTASTQTLKEGKSGYFLVSASGGDSSSFSAGFSLQGKAKIRRDYTIAPASYGVFLPTGQGTAAVLVKTRRDKSREKTEPLQFSLLPGAGYRLSPETTAIIKIADSK